MGNDLSLIRMHNLYWNSDENYDLWKSQLPYSRQSCKYQLYPAGIKVGTWKYVYSIWSGCNRDNGCYGDSGCYGNNTCMLWTMFVEVCRKLVSSSVPIK